MRWAPRGYERRGGQPLAACAHHQKIQTTRCAPTTGGPQPPAQRPPLDPRVVISLISSLALSLAFPAHKGNVGTSLSTCYILWFCEIRLRVAETFHQVNVRFQPHCTKTNVISYRVIIFYNSTAIPSKALVLVKPLSHCYDSQYHTGN